MPIEEADFDVNLFAPGAREADKNLVVKFYLEALKDEAKSVEEGRPIFSDVEMVEIRVRGDRNNIVVRQARDDDRRRFRDAYVAFKDNKEIELTGTPLKEWPLISKSLVEELKYFGFYTVEQLSMASDSVCSKMAGLQTFKQKAILWLEMSKGGAPLEQQAAEIADLKVKLEVAEQNNAALQARLADLTTKFERLAEKLGD